MEGIEEDPRAEGAAAGGEETSARPHEEGADVSEASHAPSVRSVASRDDNISARLSPRSARMSAADRAMLSARHGHMTDRSAHEAFSPAFLSPRMWNEEDMLLPPSSEVPNRPVVQGRESQDKGCFGLFTFVMVLFLFQGTAAIFGANYQMPHEFALCRSRLQQETVKTSRDIPAAEIAQHNLENGAEERMNPRDTHILMDVTGHMHFTSPHPHAYQAHIAASATRKAGAILQPIRAATSGRHLLADAELTDPISIAAGAAVGAVAHDESKFDSELESNIKAVGNAIAEAQNLTAMSPLMRSSSSGVLNSSSFFGVSSPSASLLTDHNTTQEEEESAASDKQEKEEEEDGIGVNDVGKDVTVPDPFADGAEAEKTLVTTYRRVGNASSIVALLAVSSIVFGAVWVMLLGSFTTVFVYATLFSLPLAFLASAVCLLMAGVNVVWSALLVVCFVVAVVVIYMVKERVAVTAALLTCASKALIQNFSVFFIAILLSMVQVLWLFMCFLFIGLSFMSGEAVRVWVQDVPGDQPEERCVWQTDGWAYVGMFFVVFVMLWTNSIIGEIKRYTVCGAIGLWYYGELPRSQRRNPNSNTQIHNVKSPGVKSLLWSLRTSFGSVCFSALVATTCETLKIVFRPWDYEDNMPGRRKTEHTSSLRESIWFCLEDVIGFVNHFAVPLMSISGYPFCHSAKVTSLLMHRNHLVQITEDVSPAVILRTGALVVAVCAAFAGWLLSNAYVEWAVLWEGQLRIVHTLVARFVFGASFCISILVLNFFASVLLDAMDAMFLLYAIDRDHRTIMPRGEELHAFLSQQQVGRPISGVKYTPRGWTFVHSMPATARSQRDSSHHADYGGVGAISVGKPEGVQEI